MMTLNSQSSTVYLMTTVAYMLIVLSPINVNCNINNNRKNSTLFIDEKVINSFILRNFNEFEKTFFLLKFDTA